MNPPDEQRRALLRLIPQVGELMELALSRDAVSRVPRQVLSRAARNACELARISILESPEPPTPADLAPEALAAMVAGEVERITRPHLRKVINATGVVLHTNLGRAPLPARAIDAVRETCEGYCNLEYALDTGERGSRNDAIEPILTALTGAESCLVVNNNAAAVLLVVAALARGREVIVSRGQLVEIGDSFRLPDIMRQGGAKLVEVGTTNVTRSSDYSGAIGEETALIMRVHTSNFRIEGYSEEVSLRELVEIAGEYSVPVAEDLGSGSMVDLGEIGLHGEHTARQSIEAGANLVTFSGDKLLGGPQAGLIVGSASYIDTLRRHPLARALRVCKMTVAALEASLMEYLDPDGAFENVPALEMLSETGRAVKKRALRLKRALDAAGGGLEYDIVEDTSRAGGGSLPVAELPTFCLRLSHPALGAAALEGRLRSSTPPVICRVKGDVLLLDLRTVNDDEVGALGRVLSTIT